MVLKWEPSSVQDVVAIQWAMAYWNEQTNKMRNVTKRPRVGLFAGDSCSRPKEAISQSLRFLMLLAVLSPKDSESANSVAQALKPYNLPIAAFSSSSAQALFDQGVTGFISTAFLFDYVQTLVERLKLIGNSNLVSIVDNNEDSSITDKFIEIIRQLNISISEIISVDHPNIINILNHSDAQIIVSLVNKDILATIFNLNKEFNSIAKLWVSIDWPNHNNGEGEDEETLEFINQQNANFDNSKSKLKVTCDTME
uniref:Receptor ligand binding region domain-containing protein n=1 Tax=Meloidogyne enterolobii TaxID=390850 RepID=A0A6V7ULA2_MELEN|nr:unnamed protein product [Meloidogyne enterolobii]